MSYRALATSEQTVLRVCKCACAATLLLYVALAFRPVELLLSRPFIEDTFYALAVARSIANGTGITVDGVHLTNGVQPLICLLYAPLFFVSKNDTTLALRLCLLLQVGLFVALSTTIARIVRKSHTSPSAALPWVAATLVFCNYTLSVVFLNGLETSLYVLLVLLTLELYDTIKSASASVSSRKYVLLGFMVGLTILSRIDGLFLMAAIIAAHWRTQTHESGDTSTFPSFAMFSAAVAGPALALSAPWWLYNYLLYGNLLPTSAHALQLSEIQPSSTLLATLAVISNQCLGMLHLGARSDGFHLSQIAGLSILLLAIAAAWTHPRLRANAHTVFREEAQHWKWRGLFPLVILSMLTIVAYTLYHKAPHFQARYLMLPRLLVLLGMSALAYIAMAKLRHVRLVGSIGLCAWVLASAGLHHRDFSGAGGNIMLGPASWIKENLGPEQKVGMFQSGTTGFLYPKRVINLDGKVNHEALQAVRTHNLGEYLRRERVDVLLDWPEYLSFAWRDSALFNRVAHKTTLHNRFEVWTVRARDPSP